MMAGNYEWLIQAWEGGFMRTEERIVNKVAAALEREPCVNLHRFPLYLSYGDGTLTMEGEVEHITAKKRTLEVAAAVHGVAGIVDRMRLVPATRMEDGEIRDHVSALSCRPRTCSPPAPCGPSSRASRKWCVKAMGPSAVSTWR